MAFSVNNKRVRPRCIRSVKESLSRQQGGRDIRDLTSRSRQLQAEIHHLEVVITQAPLEMTRQRLASRNTLPPLGPAARARPQQRKPLQQLRAERNRRLALYLELAVVVVGLTAALGWMRQWLQF